jgi:SOS-response transcriptional repressor LexA
VIEEVIINTLPEFSLSKIHKFLNTSQRSHITISEINDQTKLITKKAAQKQTATKSTNNNKKLLEPPKNRKHNINIRTSALHIKNNLQRPNNNNNSYSIDTHQKP